MCLEMLPKSLNKYLKFVNRLLFVLFALFFKFEAAILFAFA